MQFSCISQDFQEAFLVLSSCKGTDLTKLLKHYDGRKLPTKILRKIITELTGAIEYCWRHRIVHCDIKPPNILFSGMHDPLKLIDFGCAIDVDEDIDADSTVAGTFEYMAPEIMIDGLPAVNEHSDIYSLGVVLYEIIIRQRPWLHDKKIFKASRHEKWALIKKKHMAYREDWEELDDSQPKPTELQDILIKMSEMSSYSPVVYNLTKDMLSFLHSQRPSFEKIIKEVSPDQAVLFEGSSESGSGFIMPGSSDRSNLSRQETTISTAGCEFMKQCRITASGKEYEPPCYREDSTESQIEKEVRSDYASALDEAVAREKRVQQILDDMDKREEQLKQMEQNLEQRESSLNQRESVLRQRESVLQAQRNMGEIILETCETVFRGKYFSVCMAFSERLLLGSDENFHIRERSGNISRFIEVSNADIVGLQCYDGLVYALCLDTDTFNTGPRYVVVFAPKEDTFHEVRRWSVPDYEYLSNIVVSNDKVYVVDAMESQLCVYSLTGEEKSRIKDSSFDRPIYLAVSPPHSIIICDHLANKVHKLDCYKDTITWSSDVTTEPRGVCCDSSGDTVWVWSGNNSFVILCSQTGDLLWEVRHNNLNELGDNNNIIGMCMTGKKVIWAAAKDRILKCHFKHICGSGNAI